MKKNNSEVYINLIVKYHSRPMKEFVDYDYINKLLRGRKSTNLKYAEECRKALEFLDKFTEEYYKARFKEGEIQLHPDNLKKDCYNRNNANKRDMSSWYFKSELDVYNDGGYKDDK